MALAINVAYSTVLQNRKTVPARVIPTFLSLEFPPKIYKTGSSRHNCAAGNNKITFDESFKFYRYTVRYTGTGTGSEYF